MSQPDWADSPPARSPARVWIPGVGKHWVAILGPHTGCWIHWLGKRSYPCLGEQCPAAKHRKPIYWVAYFPVIHCDDVGRKTDNTEHHLGVLPVGADVFNVLAELGPPFRGMAFKLHKKDGSKVWSVETVCRPKGDRGLPPCFEVKSTLFRVWGMKPPATAARPGPEEEPPSFHRNGHPSKNGEVI